MAQFDLQGMSLPELKQLHKEVAIAIETFRERQKEEARAVLEAKAREMGFNLSDLAPGSARRKSKNSPARYRHPENPDLTWTGRGRRPNWIVSALESGRKLEDMAV